MPQQIHASGLTGRASAIDRLHHDFHDALLRLADAADNEFESRYRAFVQAAERTFGIEEAWMEEIGCPLMQSHREQHACLLSTLHQVHARVMNGDVSLGREVILNLLPQWFAFHVTTMDAPLSAALDGMNAEAAAVWTVPEQGAAPDALRQ
jgi:hemerythrin